MCQWKSFDRSKQQEEETLEKPKREQNDKQHEADCH